MKLFIVLLNKKSGDSWSQIWQLHNVRSWVKISEILLASPMWLQEVYLSCKCDIFMWPSYHVQSGTKECTEEWERSFLLCLSCHQKENNSPKISQKIFPQSLWPELSHKATPSSMEALKAHSCFVSSVVGTRKGERRQEWLLGIVLGQPNKHVRHTSSATHDILRQTYWYGHFYVKDF